MAFAWLQWDAYSWSQLQRAKKASQAHADLTAKTPAEASANCQHQLPGLRVDKTLR